jgi:hypothetical protein
MRGLKHENYKQSSIPAAFVGHTMDGQGLDGEGQRAAAVGNPNLF